MSKNTRRITMAVLIAVCLTTTLVACSNNNNDSNGNTNTRALKGKYVIVDVIDDPDGTTFDDLDTMYLDAGLDFADYSYVEFLDSGKYEFVLFGEIEAEGPYDIDGKTLTLAANGDVITAEISGVKIMLVYENGATLIFEKK